MTQTAAKPRKKHTNWEALEAVLFELHNAGMETFTHGQLLSLLTGLHPDLHVTAPYLTQLLRAYQMEQVKAESRTLFVLHRTGRTRAAVWHIGVRAKDVASIKEQFADDITYRAESAILPILDRIAAENPRARRHVTEAAMKIGRIIESLATM